MADPIYVNGDRLVGYEEAAAILDLDVQTLRGWVSPGKIGYFKIGRNVRFSVRELEEFIERSYVPARAASARRR